MPQPHPPGVGGPFHHGRWDEDGGGEGDTIVSQAMFAIREVGNVILSWWTCGL